MAAYEWIVVAYFSGLTLAAWLAPVGLTRRLQASALGVVVVVATVAAATMASAAPRAWIPHVFLIAGYWMPALLVPSAPDRRFEDWLIRSDRRLRRVLPSVPKPLGHLVELAYLLCYPLVPFSFAIVWLNGEVTDVRRFWLLVLLSGYACYVSLPWLVSRPPRSHQEHDKNRRGLPGINAHLLGRVSHRLNTFPSGHVAVAAAAAVSVAAVSIPAGLALGVAAVAIGVGAAAGRYHYVIDVILGLVVAAAAAAVASLV
jgi:membrane-associated phospholipid phosphatase